MNGYLFNFYKFSTLINSNMPDVTVGNDFFRSVVWSDFDRIEVRKIGDLGAYRISKAGDKNWIGERQIALAYELTEKSDLIHEEDNDECKFVFRPRTDEDLNELLFYGITLVDLGSKMYKYIFQSQSECTPGENIYQLMHQIIDKIIQTNGISNPIKYEILGVLGGQDLMIVWNANQYADILRIIEGLRKSESLDKEHIIANIYTVIGPRDINNSEMDYSKVEGSLNIKLTKRDDYKESFLESIKKVICNKQADSSPNDKNAFLKEYVIMGEHDLLLQMEWSNVIPDLYKRNGILHAKSDDFAKNIVQCKTEVLCDISAKNIKGAILDKEIKLEKDSNDNRNSAEDYTAIIDKIVESDYFKNAPYLYETLWLLYEDFMKNYMSMFSYPWTGDLNYQFRCCLEYIQTLVEDRNIAPQDVYERIKKLITYMDQMISHIGQANRIFFQMPNSYLNNTGSYSKILYTYYGVIKKYLQLAYAIPKKVRQAIVIPFITFDVTPIVVSNFCEELSDDGVIIIQIKMPYEALVNIDKYTKVLAHEIFHYVAPCDRKKRNHIVAKISFAMILGQLTVKYLESCMDDVFEGGLSDIVSAQYISIISEKVSEKVVELTDREFTGIMQTVIVGYDEELTWSAYFEAFDKGILESIYNCQDVIRIFYKLFCGLDVSVESDFAVKIIDYVKALGEDDFFNHYKTDVKPDMVMYPPDDFRYSMREALADYFMIQATNMKIDEYLYIISEYNMQMENDHIALKQCFRLGLVMTFVFDVMGISQFACNKGDPQNAYDAIHLYLEESYPKLNEYGYILDDACVGVIYMETSFGPYKKLIRDFFADLAFEDITNDSDSFEIKRDEIYELIGILRVSSFENNIHFIERMQNQPLLEDISKEIKVYSAANDISSKGKIADDVICKDISNSEKEPYFSSSMVGLVNNLLLAISDIKDEDETVPIWYRGQESSKYLLIPSIYRMADKKSCFYKDISMEQTLTDMMELFRARSYESGELFTSIDDSVVKCLTSMQHYSVPTNLMDWSLSFETALYFALNHLIDDPNSDDCSNGFDAAIYVLNPIRMNIAREQLCGSARKGAFPIYTLTDYNDVYDGYLPLRKGSSITGKDDKQYPIAVNAPIVNERISSQRGCFTIFGLNNTPKENNPSDSMVNYSEYDIYSMQREYLHWTRNNSIEYKPFLAEIRIDCNSKRDIAKQMRKMGTNKFLVYPELENIGTLILETEKNYFSSIEKQKRTTK